MSAQTTLDRPAAGTAPRAHPDAPRPADGRPAPAEPGPLLVGDTVKVPLLFTAIPGNQIKPNTPYLIVDTNGRALALAGDVGAHWNWATWAKYPDKRPEIFPVWFGRDPINTDAHFYMRLADGTDKKLYLDGAASAKWNWVAWQKSSSKVEFLGKLVPVSGTVDTFKVTANAGRRLCFDGGSGSEWNWAFIGDDDYEDNYAEVRVGSFKLSYDSVRKLIKAEWPAADLRTMTLRLSDKAMELVDAPKMQAIYQSSGLRNYVYRPEIFDCDDFAFVYKAEVSKAQYVDKPTVPYAIGLINATAPGAGGHAAIVFVSVDGYVYVLEPQNGTIVRGREWRAGSGGPLYVPTMVVF